MNETARRYWIAFLDTDETIARDTPYQVWHFGNTPEMAQTLVELVISGKKSATAGLAAVNAIKTDEAPVPDGYSVVTDYYGTPMCVIQTTEIRHVPFDDVDARFAYDEGEGDRSLDHWRSAHLSYFTREAVELGLEFDGSSVICCERFRLVFS